MIFVLLGAFLGMVGGIIHLLTIQEHTGLQVAVSLMVSCTVGTLVAIALMGTEISGMLLVAIITVGYAGTDFITEIIQIAREGRRDDE